MAYYTTCPVCGANLDPGENCTDCNGNANYIITDEMREIGLAKLQKLADRINY